MPPAFNLSQDQTLQFNLCDLSPDRSGNVLCKNPKSVHHSTDRSQSRNATGFVSGLSTLGKTTTTRGAHTCWLFNFLKSGAGCRLRFPCAEPAIITSFFAASTPVETFSSGPATAPSLPGGPFVQGRRSVHEPVTYGGFFSQLVQRFFPVPTRGANVGGTSRHPLLTVSARPVRSSVLSMPAHHR